MLSTISLSLLGSPKECLALGLRLFLPCRGPSFWMVRSTGSSLLRPGCRKEIRLQLLLCFASHWPFTNLWNVGFLKRLPALTQITGRLHVPILMFWQGCWANQQKCWTWSLNPEHRKRLRALCWDNQECFPVKLQARELGADISYCLRKAARVRNQRIAKGHQRLLRLAGLPLSRPIKQRLLFSGIFPQTLHASETALVPKSVYGRLRTKTALSIGTAKKGANPYIACLLSCPASLTPSLFRSLGEFSCFVRSFATFVNAFLDGLAAESGRYKGPSRILRKELFSLGWSIFGRATFGDSHGRSFHLVLSPIAHIEYLLSTSWSQHVTQRVTHRKGLELLKSLDLDFCRAGPGFRPNEQGLLLNQQTVFFFTEDFRRRIPGSSLNCPLCGLPDSREHRLEYCLHTSHLPRVFSSLFQVWGDLSPHEKYFGLFEELDGMRDVRAALGTVPFPALTRIPRVADVLVYTDGSCLFPRIPHLRVASYASLIVGSGGTFEILTKGLVPGGCHNAFREAK